MEQKEKELMGKRIRQEREHIGLSQEGLAEKLGMKRTNVANYEAGRVIPPSNILRDMAQIFETNSDYLLGLTDNRNPSSTEFPSWATSKDKRDFKKFLEEDTELMFDGIPISGENKQRILGYVEGMFWDAKLKNKRKK